MKKTDKPIIIKQTFDCSLEKVWNAITNLDEMKQWYFSNISSFEPKVGFETRFLVQVEDRIFPHLWRITEVVPSKIIVYHWSYEGYSGAGVVSFEIFEKGKNTELKLTFNVIEDFSDSIPEFKRESGVQGWSYFIQEALKNYLYEQKV